MDCSIPPVLDSQWRCKSTEDMKMSYLASHEKGRGMYIGAAGQEVERERDRRYRGRYRNQLDKDARARARLRRQSASRVGRESEERRRQYTGENSLQSACTSANELESGQSRGDVTRESEEIQRNQERMRRVIEECNTNGVQGYEGDEERMRGWGGEFAVREIEREVEVEELLVERARDILAVSREIEEIEAEEERDASVNQVDIEEIERHITRDQEIEEREREIDSIEEDILRLMRVRDREREREQQRMDALLRLGMIENIETVIRQARRSDHLICTGARGSGHRESVDLIRTQAEEQYLLRELDYIESLFASQELGQIGQDLDMIERFVEQDIAEMEQEMQREQEREHQALDERDWEQEVIDKEIDEYLVQNRRWR